MASEVALRDNNHVPVALAVTDDSNEYIKMLRIDDATKGILVSIAGGSFGTVTSFSFTNANGVSGVVTNSTTTPNLTISLGAITPSAVQVSGLTASEILGTDASKNLVSLAVATYPSLTELSYVKGVTSAIQTQINAKGAGTVTTVSVATANGFSGTVANATTTPAITIIAGAITPTSVNGLTITTTTGTFTLTNAKTLAVTHTLTLSGTDSTIMTFPTTSATIARTDAANTFTGASTASAWVLTSPTITTKLNPTSDDGAPLGDTTHNWSDLFLASGAVVNYANSNVVITHTSGILTMGTGTLKITTPTNTTTSVVTIDGTQTLTNKTLSGTTALADGANISMIVPTADGTASGHTTSAFVSGYTSSAIGDLVYLDSSGKWQKADADAASTASNLLGIALAVAATDAALLVALPGSFVYATAFPTMTIGVPMYAGETAGAIQAAIPTGADNIIRVIGFAVHADKIFFYPSQDNQSTVA